MPTNPTPPAGPVRLDRLTSLRFIAAFVVFGFHAVVFFPSPASRVLEVIFGQGRSGVTFFFVLSGFVLAWSAKAGTAPSMFYRRRFARIYPVYFATLLLAAALWALRDPSALRRGLFVPFLLQSWVPTNYYYFGINVPAWSLSDEAFFYLTFPLIIVLARRIGARRLLWVTLAAALVPVVLAAIASAQGVTADTLDSNTLPVWATFYFPLARLPEFLVGVCSAELLKRGALPRVPLPAAVVTAGAAYLAVGIWPTTYGVVAVPLLPFALLVVAAAQADLAGAPGILRCRKLERLGAESFCFYLVHHIFVLRLDQPGFARFGLNGPVGAAVALVLSLVAAWALHRFVEVPFERRLRGDSRVSVVQVDLPYREGVDPRG
jgi:peptidoglycan/LPS O-acetylase OafA/YrhL